MKDTSLVAIVYIPFNKDHCIDKLISLSMRYNATKVKRSIMNEAIEFVFEFETAEESKGFSHSIPVEWTE